MDRSKQIDTLNSMSGYGAKPKTPIVRKKLVKTEDDLSTASMVDKLKGAIGAAAGNPDSALGALKNVVDAPSTAGTLRDADKRRAKQERDAGA